MKKRLEVDYATKRVHITSDNTKYRSQELGPDQIIVNGKVIWFGREIER
jgi:phage repressor protein C with HTH and peptisase S24 domain